MLRVQTNGDDIKEGHLGGCAIGGDAGTYYPVMWTTMVDALGIKSVIDVGCGLGYAVDFFKDLGIVVRGVEGSREALQRSLAPESTVLHDYTCGAYIPEQEFDLAWCCEFVEHVEQRYEEHFLATFARCRYVAMTFAAPGQGGYHHVNEQPESYWIKRLETFGFEYDEGMTKLLRGIAKMDAARHQAQPNCPYFISHFITRGLFFRRSSSTLARPIPSEGSRSIGTTPAATQTAQQIEQRVRAARKFPCEDFPKPCGRDSFYRAVVQSVTIDGLWMECGVFEGGTINFVASLKPDVTLYGFDSFEGLPEAWPGVVDRGHFTLRGNLPPVRENVRLIKGWFNETLPPFVAAHPFPIAYLHIDSDIYSSAKTVLSVCAPQLVNGSVLIFDELLNYPGYEQHELRAFQEFLAEYGFGFEPLGWVDEEFSRVAVRLTRGAGA